MNQAELLFFVVQIWAALGALTAVLFLTFGIDQIDEDARGAYVFRPLLIPGVIMIWPLVLLRWYVLADGKDEWAKRYKPRRHTHKWVAMIVPAAICVVIASGLMVRQTWPADFAPIRLAPPAEASQ